MTDLLNNIRVIVHPRTASTPHALIYDLDIDDESFTIARIAEDRFTGKWWHGNKSYESREVAEQAIHSMLHRLIWEKLFEARLPKPISFYDVDDDGRPIYAVKTTDIELTWERLVDLAKEVLSRDAKFTPLIEEFAA